MRVERFLEESATRYPDKIALVVGDERLTYAEINRRADRLASALRTRGVKNDDRVVIFLDNSVEAVVGIFAVLKAGAIFSVVNATTKSDKLAYILNNCRATAVLTHSRLLPVVSPAISRVPSVVATVVVGVSGTPEVQGGVSYQEAIETAPSNAIPHEGISIDLAMIIYTSGSTGQPKGVMMTHDNIDAASASITTYLENTPDDVILSALPLSFDYGLYQVLMAFRIGALVVLENSFAFPYAILKKMAAEHVTGFPLVPTMAALLLKMKDLVPGSLPDLRYITNTAAALPPAHIQRLQALFPTTRIYSMYGLTECKRCTYLAHDQVLVRPNSVGKGIPFTEAYVVNEQGERVKPGEVGVLVIRGATVMKGYWENPEATNQMLRQGKYPWEKVLYTGDLFRVDEEGYLYFVGRSDDIIKTRGEKVSPKEVENVLYALSGVAEAAVIGVPDAVFGMTLKAIVALNEGSALTTQEIRQHCASHLEDYMVPRDVEIRDELPKTDTGKIRKLELRQPTSEE